MRPSVAVDGEKLLFEMLVHDSKCTDPDGGGTSQQMKALEKMMAEIDVCGFKIITKSCSQATTDRAVSGRSDTSCLHVKLRDDGDCRSCSTGYSNKKIEIERKTNETVIDKVALPTSAIKMGWVTVLNPTQLQESKKVSDGGEACHKESSPAQDGAAIAARTQDDCEKKELMSYKEASSKSTQNNCCPMEQEVEEISVFLAEKYFSEAEKTAVVRTDVNSYFEKAMTSSGFCLQMGGLQQGAAHQTKPESNTDLEFPACTASESDIWGSSMEDEDSLAYNFKKSNLQTTGFLQGTMSSFSADGSPLGKRHEEDPLLFVRENGLEEGKKKETTQQSSKLQWHLAKVNSQEFVMSPSLFSNSFACSISSPSKTDRTLFDRKQEESNNETGVRHAQAQDEFSFDPRSGSNGITPQGKENTAVARDAVVSHRESCPESDIDYLDKLNWPLPFHADNKHSNQNSLHRDEAAISLTIKSSSPFASPDYLIDHSNECYRVLDNVPSLIPSSSDVTAKSYQSPGYYLKKHDRNESDEYQSDMSTDLFEIDRLEAPSCVSSPASPKISIWEPITPQAMR
ncbi:hypothetical protein O6H91_01G049900 [Diphasiastrum complanatum]|nr:hypothetical protein O6H91_01G049900 [Diphasiastrum complanatum]